VMWDVGGANKIYSLLFHEHIKF